MIRKLKYIIPIAIVFVSPWMHRLAYENIRLAQIASDEDARAIALSLCLLSAFISFFF